MLIFAKFSARLLLVMGRRHRASREIKGQFLVASSPQYSQTARVALPLMMYFPLLNFVDMQWMFMATNPAGRTDEVVICVYPVRAASSLEYWFVLVGFFFLFCPAPAGILSIVLRGALFCGARPHLLARQSFHRKTQINAVVPVHWYGGTLR